MTSNDFFIELTDEPSTQSLDVIRDGLTDFNNSDVGPSNRKTLAVLVRDHNNEVIGGLRGFTAWGWLFIDALWLADETRGRGLAGNLLTMAETEAERRGCHAVWLDTFNPHALKLYEKHGYTRFGELPNFPMDRSRYFLKKELHTTN